MAEIHIHSERTGYPVSDQFHAKIYSLLSELQQRRCIVSFELIKFDLRYSLLHRDDFNAITTFQKIYPQLFNRANLSVYAITPPTIPGPCDYAYQIAAFQFCLCHPYYGHQFRRLLDSNYCARVMDSRSKFLRFQRMHPKHPTMKPPPGLGIVPLNQQGPPPSKWGSTNATAAVGSAQEMGPDVLRTLIEGGAVR